MADQAEGGLGNYPTARCLPSGMPRLMALPVQEYVITPETTYILIGHDTRRIFTDGRDWPADAEPTYEGYAIGKWIDEDGDGRYDVLDVETRGPFKGPAPTTPRGCRSISITSRPSRSGFISTRTTPTSSTTRSPCSIMP